MKFLSTCFLSAALCFFVSLDVAGQGITEACGDSAGSSWNTDSTVFGRLFLQGFEGTKLPKITVTLTDRNRNDHKYTVDKNGNYCFRGVDGGGGHIIIDIEGNEVERRSLGASTAFLRQHRQDFTVSNPLRSSAAPATISAKYAYERSEANVKRFQSAVEAESSKDLVKALQYLDQIVAEDVKDFVVWSKVGSIYYEQQKFTHSETAFGKALAARPDFGFAHMNLGRTLLAQKKVAEAIVSLKKATELEPNMARGFQLLGEAYLLDKKGTLGVEALYQAIDLDPVGMAESHLLIARLYDLAGAKPYAAREYKLFLEKVPKHQDKKKFERYIKDYPPESIK